MNKLLCAEVSPLITWPLIIIGLLAWVAIMGGGNSNRSPTPVPVYNEPAQTIQEDMIIYDALLDAGYSAEEARDAVINTMD